LCAKILALNLANELLVAESVCCRSALRLCKTPYAGHRPVDRSRSFLLRICADRRLSALSWKGRVVFIVGATDLHVDKSPDYSNYQVYSIVALSCVVSLDLRKLECCATVAKMCCSTNSSSDLIHCFVENASRQTSAQSNARCSP